MAGMGSRGDTQRSIRENRGTERKGAGDGDECRESQKEDLE